MLQGLGFARFSRSVSCTQLPLMPQLLLTSPSLTLQAPACKLLTLALLPLPAAWFCPWSMSLQLDQEILPGQGPAPPQPI